MCVPARNVPAARRLRREQTASERALWEELRDRRFLGLKFRRQHPVGAFVLDFFCPVHNVAIEIDGPVHDPPAHRLRDRDRQEIFEETGIRSLRLRTEDVVADVPAVLATIAGALAPGPAPTSAGEEATSPMPSASPGD